MSNEQLGCRIGREQTLHLHSTEKWDPIDDGLCDCKPSQTADPKEVLAELVELLEEYAPAWYTKEHHKRALAALRALEKS